MPEHSGKSEMKANNRLLKSCKSPFLKYFYRISLFKTYYRTLPWVKRLAPLAIQCAKSAPRTLRAKGKNKRLPFRLSGRRFCFLGSLQGAGACGLQQPVGEPPLSGRFPVKMLCFGGKVCYTILIMKNCAHLRRR